jgi:heme-binding protein
MMKSSGKTVRRQAAGCFLFAGLAATTIAALMASAAPDCSASGVAGILAPIGDTQRQCNTTVLSPDLQSAYNEFMAG